MVVRKKQIRPEVRVVLEFAYEAYACMWKALALVLPSRLNSTLPMGTFKGVSGPVSFSFYNSKLVEFQQKCIALLKELLQKVCLTIEPYICDSDQLPSLEDLECTQHVFSLNHNILVPFRSRIDFL